MWGSLFTHPADYSISHMLECLYSPLVETCEPIAQELVAIRHIFPSKHVHRTYNAYVLSQFKKIDQSLCNFGEAPWKQVMHLIRLLLSGVTVLKGGFVPLRLDLHREMDAALECSTLPDHPGYERANAFLIRARRLDASPEYGT
ncbi:MAG: DNA polymerase beta superfamily protein [Bryobacteraceae bacterium]